MRRHPTNLIVDQLTADLKPVRRLRSPVLYAALWLAISIAIVGGLVWHHGMRPDIGVMLAETSYRLLFIACLATAGLGAVATFMVSLPDRSAAWAFLPVPALLLWLGATGLGCYADWLRAGPDGLSLGASFSCLEWIVAVSLPLDALLIFLIRHAAFVRLRLALVVGMMSAAALASAGLMLFHEIDATLMIFVWHSAAILIMSGLAGIGAPIFRRAAGSW